MGNPNQKRDENGKWTSGPVVLSTGLISDMQEQISNLPTTYVKKEEQGLKPFSKSKVDSAFGNEMHEIAGLGPVKVKTTILNQLMEVKPDVELMRKLEDTDNKAYQHYIATSWNCPLDLFFKWYKSEENYDECMAKLAVRFFKKEFDDKDKAVIFRNITAKDAGVMIRLGRSHQRPHEVIQLASFFGTTNTEHYLNSLKTAIQLHPSNTWAEQMIFDAALDNLKHELEFQKIG